MAFDTVLARWARPVFVGLTILGAGIWVAYLLIHANGIAIDAHAYFAGSYRADTLDDALLYSPAFSQAIEPLRWLGWDGFRGAWRVAEVGVLIWLTGPLSGLLVLSNSVALEVRAGNVHLLMAGALAAGFRWPGTWAFLLLTKVTPGVGLIWFGVRREWRSLAIALGVTASIVVVSYAIDPNAWVAWMNVLAGVDAALRPESRAPEAVAIALPLVPRLVVAVVIIVWGAKTDRRWVLPVAIVLAIPTIWITSLSILVAVPFLWVNRRSAMASGPPAAPTP